MTATEAKLLTREQIGLMTAGFCPHCEQQIRGWTPASGFFAPEWWETMREHGIDGATGHSWNCPHKNVKL